MTKRLFEVGGCVRDEILGLRTKDIDFAVEMSDMMDEGAAAAFQALWSDLLLDGFEIFEIRPEFFTIRAMFPKGKELLPGVRVADFVMCRKDGPSSDGRRPDFVLTGSLMDDLERRDFTMNAIARSESGELIDPFDGRGDIERRVIRFVGDPMARLREDGLRALRGLRFSITKGFDFAPETLEALTCDEVPHLLAGVSKERMRDELDKMFAKDTRASLDLLCHVMPPEFLDVVFDKGLRMKPTMEK